MHTSASPARTLAEELATCRSLLELLASEQDLLVKAEVDGLGRTSEEKARLVASMNALAQQRHQSLAAAGFPASEAGMQDWLKQSASEVRAQQDWNSLIELAREAREQNRLNGVLIAQHMTRTQKTLNVLQGAPVGGALYGPDGQATGAGTGRRLVVG